MLGGVTDIYQPIERGYGITRGILEVMERWRHPVSLITKSQLVIRDIDILARLAERGLAKAAISVTTLERRIARVMEPRAAAPHRRIEAIRMLAEAGVPMTVMVAPIVPAINDSEIEAILEECAKAGASAAGYVVLRLPLEIKDLFREWLQHALSRSRHARDDAGAPDAQRARLRSRMGQAPEGRGALRQAHRRPFRGGVPPVWPGQASLPLDHTHSAGRLELDGQPDLFADDDRTG